MKTLFKMTLLLLFLLAGSNSIAQTSNTESLYELSGIYTVKGENYEGKVIIRRKGESYTLSWLLGNTRHNGIGMRSGNMLASSWPGGVVVYEIGENRRLSGHYPANDGTLRQEILTFQGPLPTLPAPRNWEVGASLLVNWSKDDYWYPATVAKKEAGRYFVVFADGDEEWTVAEKMTVEDIGQGDRVYGNWKQSGKYYPGRITQRNGKEIHIQYDDGDTEDTTIASVRVFRPRIE